MPSNFAVTPTSTTVLGTNDFPVSAVFVPGTASGNLTALQGGPSTTDGNSYTSAPMAVYTYDGNNVALGTTTDLATTTTLIGLTKAIKANTASVTIGSLPAISGTVTANAGTNLNTSALALESGGNLAAIVAALDDGQETMANSLSVAIASDQSAVPVSGTFWQATQPISGTVTANAGSGIFNNQQSNIQSDYDTGAGVQLVTMFGIGLPASGGAVPGGTTANPLKVDPTGTTTQPISGTVTANAGSGTFTVAQATGTNLHAVVDSGTVTANIGTTAGVALDATVAKLNVAQAAALGSNTGPMMQGSVTTSAPTYVTGNINPISLTTAGALRTDASATTQPISGTITANAGTNLNTSALALESGGNLATLAGGVSSSKYQSTIAAVAASLTQANQVPVSNAGQQGKLALSLSSLTANSDNSITFTGNSTVARRIRIQNESTGVIYWDADATASNGSPSLINPGANAVTVEWVNMAITTLHIFIPSGGTTVLNGSGGVKVSAWA